MGKRISSLMVERITDELKTLAQTLWENPEIAYQEKREIKKEVAKIVTTYKYSLIDYKE